MPDLRSLIINHAPKTQPVATPFWSEKDPQTGEELVDGHISFQDIPSDEVVFLRKALSDGRITGDIFNAALLVKSLVDTNTRQPIFGETDRDSIAKRGISEMTPLVETMQIFFGVNKSANIEDTKKNLETTQSDLPGLESAKDAYIQP